MRATELINEWGIERLDPEDYVGGAKSLKLWDVDKKSLKPLPGGSRFKYTTSIRTALGKEKNDIFIVDPANRNQLVGRLVLEKYPFPIRNAYSVDAITVDEKYRGQGIALALYGIALSILKITLIAGWGQTPGGIKNWTNLITIPGCEVLGYLRVADKLLTDGMIDRVMMLGGEYIGELQSSHYFSFPVTINKTELANAVKGSDVKVYDGYNAPRYIVGLFARWKP